MIIVTCVVTLFVPKLFCWLFQHEPSEPDLSLHLQHAQRGSVEQRFLPDRGTGKQDVEQLQLYTATREERMSKRRVDCLYNEVCNVQVCYQSLIEEVQYIKAYQGAAACLTYILNLS